MSGIVSTYTEANKNTKNTFIQVGQSNNHGHVYLVPCKKTCPVYASVHVYTGNISFTRYQKHTTMFNWSPCIQVGQSNVNLKNSEKKSNKEEDDLAGIFMGDGELRLALILGSRSEPLESQGEILPGEWANYLFAKNVWKISHYTPDEKVENPSRLDTGMSILVPCWTLGCRYSFRVGHWDVITRSLLDTGMSLLVPCWTPGCRCWFRVGHWDVVTRSVLDTGMSLLVLY